MKMEIDENRRCIVCLSRPSCRLYKELAGWGGLNRDQAQKEVQSLIATWCKYYRHSDKGSEVK